MRKRVIISVAVIIFIASASGTYMLAKNNQKKQSFETSDEVVKEETIEEEIIAEKEKKEIIISAAGDCTIGEDSAFNAAHTVSTVLKQQNNDYSYFMKNVKEIFDKDDYTIVNLENPFTKTNKKADKGEGRVFHFKGDPSLAKVLTEGSIEGVTIANNHIYDYGSSGYQETIKTLKEEGIEYCGEENKILKDIKGIKFGFLGYQAWSDNSELRVKIKADIEKMKDRGANIVIPYFHWGIERDALPHEYQQNLARYTIDSGADMVLGSHPHVIQTLENYKDKLIVYSLSNFCFGGNFNPDDKRSFIIQVKFNFEDNILEETKYKVIPVRISSKSNWNDYVPTPLEGSEKNSVLDYINSLSKTLRSKITDEFGDI
ncbi:MAG: CapA family protein [Sarcina sp.]